MCPGTQLCMYSYESKLTSHIHTANILPPGPSPRPLFMSLFFKVVLFVLALPCFQEP